MHKSLTAFSARVVEIMPFMLREFMRRERNPLTRGKISFPQMVALHVLSRELRVQMKDFARILSIKMSSATVLVDRLIQEEMAIRRRDERDRRVVWVTLAPKGRRVIKQILKEKEKSIRTIFGILNSKERGQYLRILEKVQSHLHPT